MCHGVSAVSELRALLANTDAIVLGPGLGRSAWAQELWTVCLDSDLPLVLDADGLNLLAESPRQQRDWLLTPHPGEAARLLATDTATIQADRIAAIQRLVERYGGTVVLKGAGTLIAAAGRRQISLCDIGNPGMATGGTGDVLAGVLGALRAQNRDSVLAAEAGVFVHAQAGDNAARAGERGLLAGDLMPFIRKAVNP
jgi:NAD(P)H-hydrate epimerase